MFSQERGSRLDGGYEVSAAKRESKWEVRYRCSASRESGMDEGRVPSGGGMLMVL